MSVVTIISDVPLALKHQQSETFSQNRGRKKVEWWAVSPSAPAHQTGHSSARGFPGFVDFPPQPSPCLVSKPQPGPDPQVLPARFGRSVDPPHPPRGSLASTPQIFGTLSLRAQPLLGSGPQAPAKGISSCFELIW